MKKIATYLLLLFSLAGLWAGCTRSEDDVWPSKEENVPVRFQLNIPDISTPRAMLDSDEERVETIDILAFIQDGANYRYSYRREGKNYSANSFTVDLISYSSNQILVVLVNARTELAAASILLSDNVEQALEKIIVDSPDEWPAGNGNGNGAAKAIPMAGISPATRITEGMTEFPATLSLIRMLARVNITLKQNDSNGQNGVQNFELKTAQLFNRVTKGYVGHKPASWGTTAWVPLDDTNDQKPYKTLTPSYTYQADGSGIASNITNKIYTLESPGVTLTDYLESTAIVVGGTYTSPDGTSHENRYYRIDLTANGLLGATAVDILRTHSYNIEIQSVDNIGASTALEAYEGVITLKASVNGWEESTNTVIVDGQYYLSLEYKKLVFGSGVTDMTMNITTSHPDGITLDKGMVNGNWCTVTETGIPNGYSVRIVTTAYTIREKDFYRWSGINVSAGNMKYLLEILQGFDPWLSSNDLAAGYSAAGAGDAAAYTFTIASPEAQWVIRSISDPNNILISPERLQGLAGENNTTISFYLKSTAQSGQRATLTFSDPAEINPDTSLSIVVAN